MLVMEERRLRLRRKCSYGDTSGPSKAPRLAEDLPRSAEDEPQAASASSAAEQLVPQLPLREEQPEQPEQQERESAPAPAPAQEPEGAAPPPEVPAGVVDPVANISDYRLASEVQNLLVGVEDLDSTTLGQFRGALEARLGLGAGTLGSRKQLRRRVSRVVEAEVAKRTQRGQDCDRVVRALVELEGYPADVRQMLINSLPFAFGIMPDAPAPACPTSPLHEHQVRVLAIVRDALDVARAQTASAEAAHSLEEEACQALLAERQAACAAAAEAEGVAAGRAESVAAAVKGLREEVASAGARLAEAETAANEAAEQASSLRCTREAVVALRDGPLYKLLSGSWEGDEDWGDAVSSVMAYFKAEGAGSSLLAAAPGVLARQPSERSSFDDLVVKNMSTFIDERIGAADARLAVGTEAAASAQREAAAAQLDSLTEQLAACSKAKEDADEDVQATASARKVAEAAAAEQRTRGEAVAASGARILGKAQELDSLLALVDARMAGPSSQPEPCEPAAPDGAHPSEAPADAPASAADAPAAAAGEAVAEDAEMTEAAAAGEDSEMPEVPAADATAPAAAAADTPAPADEAAAAAEDSEMPEALADVSAPAADAPAAAADEAPADVTPPGVDISAVPADEASPGAEDSDMPEVSTEAPADVAAPASGTVGTSDDEATAAAEGPDMADVPPTEAAAGADGPAPATPEPAEAEASVGPHAPSPASEAKARGEGGDSAERGVHTEAKLEAKAEVGSSTWLGSWTSQVSALWTAGAAVADADMPSAA